MTSYFQDGGHDVRPPLVILMNLVCSLRYYAFTNAPR